MLLSLISSGWLLYFNFTHRQGCNARKVISEVYAFIVLQSLGGKVNRRRISQPDMESTFTKIMYENSGHRKLLFEFSKLSKLNALNLLGYQTNTVASILVYKFRPERNGFNMYAEYTQPQLTFLPLVPCAQVWEETNYD